MNSMKFINCKEFSLFLAALETCEVPQPYAALMWKGKAPETDRTWASL